MTPTAALPTARLPTPPRPTIEFTFSAESADEGNRVVVTLRNTGTDSVRVTGLVVSGPVSEGDNATVMTAGLTFAPVPPFSAILGPKGRCNFVAPPALMAAFRSEVPANWWVQARCDNFLVAEVTVEPLLAAINLCLR
jgi:hypothetical protein